LKTTVIHHSADFDGLFCREIARKFLPDAELIGWDYGDAPLQFPSEGTVYVLDLSPDCFEQTKHVQGAGEVVAWMDANRLIWIDHHKSAIEKWPKDIPGYRIDGVAACRLAWFYFTALELYTRQTVTGDFTWFQGYYPWATKQDFIDRKVSEPLAVRLAGEYDIWDKRDPDAELFQHGLRSRELNDITWKYLLGDDRAAAELCIGDLLDGGKAIQYAKTKENASIIKSAGFDVEFEGLKFLACNHARYNSHLFTAGLKPEHEALLGFAWRDGQWAVSLYHAPGKEHHDLSEIAKKYGGGGHRGACGFRTKTLPFIQ
jgi:hypothetical protein